jgi:CRISPR-associated protein Cmr6
VKQKDQPKPEYMLPLYQPIKEIPEINNAHDGLLFQKFWCWNRAEQEWDNKAWIKKWDGKKVGDPALLQDYAQRLTKLAGPQGTFLYVKNTERVVIGMGLPHALENGLTWHPTLGVPYIPGSSLKGMVRNWARLEEVDDETLTRIFGNDPEAAQVQVGSVIFMDMIPLKPIKLEQDIMTSHFQEYYHDPGNFPHDRYHPNPISFLTIAEGQSFVISLIGRGSHNQEDINQVINWIGEALKWEGLGAKTAVGYGRFKRDEDKEREIQAQKLAMQKLAEEQQRQAELAKLPPVIREMKENGYDHDSEQFMRTMSSWFDRMEAANTVQEDRLQIANLLKQWYDLHRPGQWTKPNQKNKAKIRRIKVILGE